MVQHPEAPSATPKADGSVSFSFRVERQIEVPADNEDILRALDAFNIGYTFAYYGPPNADEIIRAKYTKAHTEERKVNVSQETIEALRKKGYHLTAAFLAQKILFVPGGQYSYQIKNLTCYILPEGELLVHGTLEADEWCVFAETFARHLQQYPDAHQAALYQAVKSLSLQQKKDIEVNAFAVSSYMEKPLGFFIPPNIVVNHPSGEITALGQLPVGDSEKPQQYYTLTQLLEKFAEN